MVADSRNTVQKPAARRSRRLLWCSPTKTRRRQPARWPSLAPSPASQPYQPLTTPKTGAQSVAHFAKPVRIPRRERAENPKTTRKTARRTVKTLNKGPNFRMFGTFATPFLFDWPSCTPAWHYSGGNPHLVRKQRHCKGVKGWPRSRHVGPTFARVAAAWGNREGRRNWRRAGRNRVHQ